MFMLRIALLAMVVFFGAIEAGAQAAHESAWWPSQWGEDDERGAANRLTPEKVLEATALIEEGRVYEP